MGKIVLEHVSAVVTAVHHQHLVRSRAIIGFGECKYTTSARICWPFCIPHLYHLFSPIVDFMLPSVKFNVLLIADQVPGAHQ
jgi:hypothetical protein